MNKLWHERNEMPRNATQGDEEKGNLAAQPGTAAGAPHSSAPLSFSLGYRTALVIIDLDTATVGSKHDCERVAPGVNKLASAGRKAGGLVAWVVSHMAVIPRHFSVILGAELATKYFHDGHGGVDTLLRKTA